MKQSRVVPPETLEIDCSCIIEGDAHVVLGRLPDKSVQSVITSPPYWGLRDYKLSGQIGLEQIRGLYLREALSAAVGRVDIKELDAELGRFVPNGSLGKLASRGLRGELMFGVPCLLAACPRLLGYYRLMLGFSQKAFYTSGVWLDGLQIHGRKRYLERRPIRTGR